MLLLIAKCCSSILISKLEALLVNTTIFPTFQHTRRAEGPSEYWSCTARAARDKKCATIVSCIPCLYCLAKDLAELFKPSYVLLRPTFFDYVKTLCIVFLLEIAICFNGSSSIKWNCLSRCTFTLPVHVFTQKK